MGKIEMLADIAQLGKRKVKQVDRFSLHKEGQGYYIYANGRDFSHPVVVGRYTDPDKARQAMADLENTIRSAKKDK